MTTLQRIITTAIFVWFYQTKCQSFHKSMLFKNATTCFIVFNWILYLRMAKLEKIKINYIFQV